MFVLEIDFHDGSDDAECLLVRRPGFAVGATKSADVIIDEMKGLGYELQFLRGLGRRFRCLPRQLGDIQEAIPSFLENGYDFYGNFNVGPLAMRVTALDTDLLVRESDPPDRAGTRILKQACAFDTPQLPAIALLDVNHLVVSFPPEQTLTVGRSNKCLVRVNAADVSAEHARIGFESGAFWVEDLGSTNGTFVDHQQISGRQQVKPGVKIVLGGQTVLTGISSETQLQSLLQPGRSTPPSDEIAVQRSVYPALVSISDLVRPGRFLLQPGTVVLLGRDPESDIWVGAPHISRKHCSISVGKTGKITITDLSRNGIAWEGGILSKGQEFTIEPDRQVFDLGGGVNIAICFTSEDEDAYRINRGSFLIAQKERKVAESGTRVDLKTLLEQSNEQPALLNQNMPDRTAPANSLYKDIALRFGKLEVRDKFYAVLFLISFSIIVIVVVNLIMQGFN